MENGKPSLLYDPNFLHDRAYEGVWDFYDDKASKHRVWTLQSYKVACVMAVLVVLVEFTGVRFWMIARRIVIAIFGTPVRLGEDEPIEHLSRGKAIWIAFPAIQKFKIFDKLLNRASKSGMRSRSNDPGQSIWFGITAIVCLISFSVLDAAMPYFLTDGILGTPVIKTRVMSDCSNVEYWDNWFAAMHWKFSFPKADAIFQECDNFFDEACYAPYRLVSPKIEKNRLDHCPFPAQVCQNETKPFEITHLNVSAYEMGINSPGTFSFNHRLTCAPVVTTKFMVWAEIDPEYGWITAQSLQNLTKIGQIKPEFSLRLKTLNGPNFLSTNSSGKDMALKEGKRGVTILPKARFYKPLEGYRDFIDPRIRRDDGKSFLVVLQAGAVAYHESVNDPFFRAHNPATFTSVMGEERVYYLPDYEATALACLEQYQICTRRGDYSDFCSDWGEEYDTLGQAILHLLDEGNQQVVDSIYDTKTYFKTAIQGSSVYTTLALRNEALSSSSQLRDGHKLSMNYTGERWPLEVETWFMRAIMDMNFRLKLGARYSLGNFSENSYDDDELIQRKDARQWMTCGRVLFRDNAYTNINWYGFHASWASLAFVCLISYLLDYIELAALKSVKFIKAVNSRITRLSRSLRVQFLFQWISSSALATYTHRFTQSLSRILYSDHHRHQLESQARDQRNGNISNSTLGGSTLDGFSEIDLDDNVIVGGNMDNSIASAV